jgi:hypothetical protein
VPPTPDTRSRTTSILMWMIISGKQSCKKNRVDTEFLQTCRSQSVSEIQELPRAFKGVWIPREIWEHSELDFFEKCLWAEIDSLDDPKTGCIASNPYLQKFFGVKERVLQRGLSKLRKLNLISYVSFDGRRRVIRSHFITSGVSNLTPHGCQKRHPENKEKNKEYISPIVPKGTPQASPSPKKKEKEEKTQVAPEVWLTDKQQTDLLTRLKEDADKLAACYDKLSSWKISKGKTGGSDYLSIIKWVIKAVEEVQKAPKPVDRSAADKEFAHKIKQENQENSDIILGHNYLEFKLGRMGIPDPHLVFGDAGFQEQAENNLRKIVTRNIQIVPQAPLDAPKIDHSKNPNSIVELKKQRILRHKEQAKEWEGKKWMGFDVVTNSGSVFLKEPSGIREVRYDVSDLEWENRTGWKN